MIGELVGTIRIGSRAGRTGIGELWHGAREDGTAVTLQLLPAGATSFAASFVEHPSLARTLETGVHGTGQPYLVLEPVRGEPLEELVERSGRLGATQACDIAGKIASALHALHRANHVHRGLSPSGVFVDGDRVTLLDAGLAAAPTTVTAPYTAPELWNHGKLDGRADIYALGCMTFEMASGRSPFIGATFEELPDRHRKEPAPLLSSVVDDIPKTLDMLVSRMLAKSADDRPRAASELSFVFELVEDNNAVAAFSTTIKEKVE